MTRTHWRNPKSLAIGAVIILAAGWAIVAINGSGKNKTPPTPPVQVSTAAVMRQDVPMAIREVGTVAAYQTVSLRSRLDSQIMEVRFRDGDMVQKGDLLFVLDDRALKAQLAEMEANLRRDKAQLENFRAQYERLKGLAKQGYVSQADLDTAHAAYDASRASVGATAASLDNVRVQLQFTRITAPITGRTGTINVTVGNTVKANDTGVLVTINQTQPILVQMTLSQSYFDSVRKAMSQGKLPVSAMREGTGASSEGTLEYIDNTVNQASGTFVTRASFPNKDEQLWPGMFVTAMVRLGTEKQAITVPEVAVQHGQSGDYVFVIAGDKASKRDIKLSRTEGGVSVIREGLKENEHVAIDGMMSLKDGSTVAVKK